MGPKTMASFLNFLSTIGDPSERLPFLEGYIRRLENEVSHMQPSDGELAHNLGLLKDAMKAFKAEEMKGKKRINSESEQSAVTELCPLMRKPCREEGAILQKDCRKEKQWISSSLLWSTACDINQKSSNIDVVSKSRHQSAALDIYQPCWFINGKGAFSPLTRSLGFPATSSAVAANEGGEDPIPRTEQGRGSLTFDGSDCAVTPRKEVGSRRSKAKKGNKTIPLTNGRKKNNNNKNGGRKPLKQRIWKSNRRCWTPDLHARFVHALQVHGGPEAATPKQIREVMQVEGLTNDQVKSHLQKYRLHYRRLSAANHANQTLVFEELWAPMAQPRQPSSFELTSLHGPLHYSIQPGLRDGSQPLEAITPDQ